MKILFITNYRLGDAVLSTCILNKLQTDYPHAKFTVVCGKVPAQLFEAMPGLQKISVIEKQTYHRHWFKLWWGCLFTRWDCIIDLRGSAISLLLWAKKRYYKQPPKSETEHKVLSYLKIIKSDTLYPPTLWIGAQHEREADSLLKPEYTYIAIAPAANWRAKTWPLPYFIDLTQQLIDTTGDYPGATVIVMGAPAEHDYIQPLIDALPAHQVLDLVGKAHLLTLAACIKRAQLFIGNDSGLAHLAAATGTPTLALFGPTNKETYGPFGNHTHVICTPEPAESLMQHEGFDHKKSGSLMHSLTVSAVSAQLKHWLAPRSHRL